MPLEVDVEAVEAVGRMMVVIVLTNVSRAPRGAQLHLAVGAADRDQDLLAAALEERDLRDEVGLRRVERARTACRRDVGLVGSANETLMTSQLLETSFSWMLPEPLSKLCQ